MDDRVREVMTAQELADYLRVHVGTVHRLLKRGEIPSFRVGTQWRFAVEEIEGWIADRPPL